MSCPPQESYGQFSQGFYDSGFTMEGEAGAPAQQQHHVQTGAHQAYAYDPGQQAFGAGTGQWASGGQQEYYNPQGYSGVQQGGYTQQGRLALMHDPFSLLTVLYILYMYV